MHKYLNNKLKNGKDGGEERRTKGGDRTGILVKRRTN